MLTDLSAPLPFGEGNAYSNVNRVRSLEKQHIEAVKMGASAVDEWRRDNPASRLDLTGADLRGLDFSGWNLSRALLDSADLSGVSLQGADLSECWIRRASLTGANLRKASLYRANLAGSDLSGADLRDTQMYRCILRDSILDSKTNFQGAHVAKVIWPEINRR